MHNYIYYKDRDKKNRSNIYNNKYTYNRSNNNYNKDNNCCGKSIKG